MAGADGLNDGNELVLVEDAVASETEERTCQVCNRSMKRNRVAASMSNLLFGRGNDSRDQRRQLIDID
jgi:hypothetical protein